MRRLLGFFGSMTGQIFLILAIGMSGAAVLAAWITISASERDFERQQLERAADRVEAALRLIDALPASSRMPLLASGGAGVRLRPTQAQDETPDDTFQSVLGSRGGLAASAKASVARLDVCLPELRRLMREDVSKLWQSAEVQRALKRLAEESSTQRLRASLRRNLIYPPTCRVIAATLSDGTALRFSIDTPWIERERSRFLEPAFVSMLLVAIVLLAYVVARIATAPLKRMSRAAAELGQDLGRAPLTLSGSSEVRRAAAAFNAMQERLQRYVSERTRMLAAITHDLQTPLTRLRLRLEKVEDEELREKLVGDLGAMKALIDEGLELARSAETSESKSMLDLDSLLQSLVEDAVDAGGAAVFEQGCGAVLPLRPLAARRLFSNLIDNALKYGGRAEVSAVRHGDEVNVYVRDRGPGIPQEMLERVFDPFVRLEDSRSRESGGAGLGLTIARTLAERNGATLVLRNRPEGGLEACVSWKGVA
jgi:signal transduction histidine kinase